MWANWVAIARNQHFLATDMPRVTRASAGLRVPTAIALLLCALSALLLPSPAAMALIRTPGGQGPPHPQASHHPR